MNQTRIIELRQAQGWTQERLANASGVGLRTVQRLEAGQDTLETLTLVAEALQVPVQSLFTSIDNAALSSRVDSLQDRTDAQQAARDRISGAWRWLYIGIGVILTLLGFTFPQGFVLFLGYWIGGYCILTAVPQDLPRTAPRREVPAFAPEAISPRGTQEACRPIKRFDAPRGGS